MQTSTPNGPETLSSHGTSLSQLEQWKSSLVADVVVVVVVTGFVVVPVPVTGAEAERMMISAVIFLPFSDSTVRTPLPLSLALRMIFFVLTLTISRS